VESYKKTSRKDLWGNPAEKVGSYWVFHDEGIPNKRWLLIGLLFVHENHLEEARHCLKCCRQSESYYDEIHFSDLPKNFEGKFGAKAHVARQWFKAYEDGLKDIAWFTALAVDRHSPAFEHKRFTKDFHVYNRFTAMALKAGIAWFLVPQEFDKVFITFVSDAKDRRSRPDKGWVDNFEKYIPNRAKVDAFLSQTKGRPYPQVIVSLDIQHSSKDDLLQLCDILLGATQEAIVAGSNHHTKRELGRFILRWWENLCRPREERAVDMQRKFNLWAFPNERGAPYTKIPFKLSISDEQLKLF